MDGTDEIRSRRLILKSNTMDEVAENQAQPLGEAQQLQGVTELGSCKQYRRPRAEILNQYEIRIEFHSIGMVIRVGCRAVPFTSTEAGMLELNEYVKNPQDTIDKWMKIFGESE